MSRHWLGYSIAICLGTTTGLNAADNPKIKVLKHEVEELKHQEKATIKAIEAHYDNIIRRGKLSEAELERERHAVHEREKELLAHAVTEEQKTAIRARFDEMRHYLSKDIHLDAEKIEHLRKQRHEHVEHVKHVYHERIHHLEEEIRALEHEHKSKPPKK
jgi:hypothetical protein